MRKVLLILLLGVSSVFAQTYPEKSLYDLNFIPMDSLVIADSSGVNGRSSLTDTQYLNDTVTVTGVVLTAPPVVGNVKVSGNWSFYMQSEDSAEWGGMNVFYRDSNAAITAGYGAIDTGYVIQLTGVLTKYSSTSIMGNFELMPIPGDVSIVGINATRPKPAELKLSDLVEGDLRSGGKMKFNPGTKYKGAYVIVRNVIVKDRVKSSSGQWNWTIADAKGNTIGTYDISQFFSARSYGLDPNWEPPPPGSKLDYVRGILMAYSSYGYEIAPMYPGDIKGNFAPSITATGFATRRSLAFPGPSDPVTVKTYVEPTDTNKSVVVDSVFMHYSVDNGNYTRIKMTTDTADTYVATIPAEPTGSFVKYFFEAWSNSFVSLSPDTSSTALFYYVRTGNLTIRDVQYTPFKDGNSGAVDLPVTVSGVIQADTSDFPAELDHRNNSPKTPKVFMQNGTSPWSGIMLYDTLAYSLHKGDSVSVTGTVSEYSGMTELTVTSVNVVSQGNPIHTPVKLETGAVGGKPSGNPAAEMWESMLVRFDSLSIINNDPDPSYSITSDNGSFREYTVSDGSGQCRVDDDGSNTYSVDPHDTTWGFTILPKGTKIESLTGILEYTFGNYKLYPRTNSDFGTVTGVRREPTPIPRLYSLDQNYPNPFNPTTTIRYTVPNTSKVTVKVYNVLGQEVAMLVNIRQSAGTYTVKFDASRFASGVYFYRLTAGSFSSVKKMMLLK